VSSTLEERVCRGIIDELLTTLSEVDAQLIQKLKKCHAKKYPSVGIVSNATILSHTTPEEKMLLLPILKTKSMRTISGIAVVAVISKELHWTRTFYDARYTKRLRPLFASKDKT